MKYLQTIFILLIAGTAMTVGAQSLPQITTGETTNRDVTEARLTGNVQFTSAIPFGQVYFVYGRTSLYGSRTPVRTVTETGPFSEKVAGLNEETSYNYRAVLIASDETVLQGQNRTFITKRFSDPRDLPDEDTGDNTVAATSTTATTTEEEDANDDGLPDNLEENEESGGTGVTVGTPSNTGGGSLISNSDGAPAATGGLNTNIPEGSVGIADVCDGPDCGFNDAIQLINRIINWIVGISVFVATAVLVYGGILYMVDGGKSTQVSKAKKMWKSALIGLFFVLTGWLIVDFVMDKLVAPNFLDQETNFLEENGTQ